MDWNFGAAKQPQFLPVSTQPLGIISCTYSVFHLYKCRLIKGYFALQFVLRLDWFSNEH